MFYIYFSVSVKKNKLLYLFVRNWYYDFTEYLFQKGINVDEVQSTGSTTLNGAGFYGHELIIWSLTKHEINTKIKNINSSKAEY